MQTDILRTYNLLGTYNKRSNKFEGSIFIRSFVAKVVEDGVLNFHRAERGSCNLWRGRCFYITIFFAGSGTIIDILVDLS
ncbi:hypothetical protein R1flu_002492 [Riccia fluitans]|uniref:Uncharacterized protein n=1 Tax=Riccia fluitans TaxID=41844 RepID=A0ABD1Y695_9MARC